MDILSMIPEEVVTLTAGGTIAAKGDLVGINASGTYVQADANAATAIRAEYIAVGGDFPVASGGTFQAIKRARIQTTGLTAGAIIFLSATAGGITQTNPLAAAGTAALQVLGIAVSTTEAILDCDYPQLVKTAYVQGAAAATATNFGYVFTADRPYELVYAVEVHRTAGNDAGAVTLGLEKCTPGTAQGSGVDMLVGTFNLKGAAATPQAVLPSATPANTRLNPGDSIVLKDTGVLTTLADVCVTFVLVPRL